MQKIINFLFFIVFPLLLNAQQIIPNYDEAKVPAYTLPDPLVFNNGSAVKSRKDWEKRRVEIYRAFEKEVFGVVPQWKGSVKSTVVSRKTNALGGLAKRKEVRLDFINGDRKISVMVLIYLPQNSTNAPVFLSYNFDGNHTITTEPDILITDSWVANNKELGITDNRANERGRGVAVSRRLFHRDLGLQLSTMAMLIRILMTGLKMEFTSFLIHPETVHHVDLLQPGPGAFRG